MKVDSISFHFQTYKYVGEEHSTCVCIELTDDKNIDCMFISTVKLLMENGIRKTGEKMSARISDTVRDPKDVMLFVDVESGSEVIDTVSLLKRGCCWVMNGNFRFPEELKSYGECYRSAKDGIETVMKEIVNRIDNGRYYQYYQFIDGMN